MSFVRTFVIAMAAAMLAAAPAAAQQTILGKSFIYREKPGAPSTRLFTLKAIESGSPNTLSGDPQANGGSVTLIANGATSGTQTFTLPAGAAWKRIPGNLAFPASGWLYKDTRGTNSSLTSLKMKAKGGKFAIGVMGRGKVGGGITVGAPNPASYVGVVVTFNGAGGDSWCMNYGGAVGGNFTTNSAVGVKVVNPVSEGTCPSVSAVCGDGVIQSPAETCDVGNDAACPGQCGANGLPCVCPFCGDTVIDAGESCDGQAALGSCTEGCSFGCTCTTCGDAVQESPVEECDATDDLSCPSMCLPPGGPNQCACPICGDDEVNQGSEACDGTDDSACPGLCIGAFELNECQCAVCGNNVAEVPAEQCDGTDDGACPGLCSVSCTCP